jgi:FAD/FMN-containing dehydrogenase
MNEFEALAGRMDGDVVGREDPGYDDARQIWNASIDRRPALVARCAGEADVVLALAYAQERDLPIAVRGGGHSVAGMGTCDDGLVVSLAGLAAIEVDPEARRVRVGGGALLGAVDKACQVHDLATPAGVVSHTGVGGLALGGGVGWLTRKYGLTCDSLREARVVTPAGEVLTASADSNPELHWGLRGGGGNFGVCTEFTFACHPVPRRLPVGFGVWALDDAPAVLRRYRELMPEQPDEVKGTVFFIKADDRLGVDREHVGRHVVAIVQPWIGEDPEAAERAFAPLLEAAPAIRGEVTPMRWLDLQTMEDDVSGHGKGNYTKGGYLDEISDGLIEVVVEAARAMPGAESQLEIIPHGGAQLAVAEADSAFSDRAAAYSFNVYSRWPAADDPGPYVGWSRGTHAAMEPYVGAGVYTNFFAVDDGQDRVLAAYGAEKYERLARLKATYDPGNVLALNQNIRPADPIADGR